jgi:hypothetical protein
LQQYLPENGELNFEEDEQGFDNVEVPPEETAGDIMTFDDTRPATIIEEPEDGDW